MSAPASSAIRPSPLAPPFPRSPLASAAPSVLRPPSRAQYLVLVLLVLETSWHPFPHLLEQELRRG